MGNLLVRGVLGRALGMAITLVPAVLVASVAPVAPAYGQEAPACAPGSRALTGDWTTTETIDGQNTSFWRGTLRLVQRGAEVAGRWEPPDGAPERAVLGTFSGGVLRAMVRGSDAQPAAAVPAAPARTWLLTVSSDGTLLTGRWSDTPSGASDSSTASPHQGVLVISGEAGCTSNGGTGLTEGEAVGAAAAVGTESPCAAWDLSGTWEAAASADGQAPWRLRLWQDGESLLGWYEPAGGGVALATAPAWTVDGTLRGRTLSLQEYLGDSTTLARTLVLDPSGTALSGSWPLPFGPDEREILRGQARCRAS